jgi:hypothetical protein
MAAGGPRGTPVSWVVLELAFERAESRAFITAASPRGVWWGGTWSHKVVPFAAFDRQVTTRDVCTLAVAFGDTLAGAILL